MQGPDTPQKCLQIAIIDVIAPPQETQAALGNAKKLRKQVQPKTGEVLTTRELYLINCKILQLLKYNSFVVSTSPVFACTCFLGFLRKSRSRAILCKEKRQSKKAQKVTHERSRKQLRPPSQMMKMMLVMKMMKTVCSICKRIWRDYTKKKNGYYAYLWNILSAWYVWRQKIPILNNTFSLTAKTAPNEMKL